MDDVTISFIIPCYNSEATIGRVLEGIDRVRRPGDEVILVDNGSSDRTVEIAEQFEGVTMVPSEANTIATVRNDGAARANGDWLAFVDSDCVIDPEWRTHLLNTISDNRVRATGSGLSLPDRATWLEHAWLCGQEEEAGQVEYITTANLIVHADAFRQIDGFDGRLETDEDTDICWRIIDQFGKEALVGSPGMRAVHLGNSKTVAQYWRRQYWHASGMVASARKNGIDRALAMTLAFAALHIFGLIWIALKPTVSALIGMMLLILVIPALTALYRARASECVRWFFHLVLLYTLFYYARCLRGTRDLLSGNTA